MARTKQTEKLSITLPQELAAELRKLVPPGEVSAFIADAVRFSLALRRQKEALEQGFGIWSDENHPDLMTPEDSSAYVRKLRETEWERTSGRADSDDE